MTINKRALSLTEAVRLLHSGDLSPLEYLDQLEAVFDEIEAQVRAFIPEDGRFERLRREAEALMARYPNRESRPPLYGVPVGVKDIFHVDGFVTQAGSNLPTELLQGEQAESVTLLRAAGALILGKTVTTEFAYFAPGPTRNPHTPNHTPGGSSSGSAAAVAAGLCPLALGTQTIGSVTRPAAFCGVVGYKPTYERISTAGVIPLSESLDHVGCFTPEAAGMQLVAGLLCAEWQAVNAAGEPVLGVPEGPYLDHADTEGLAHFRHTCDRLREAGYAVKPVPAMPDFEAIYDRHQMLMAAEAATFHADWYAQYQERYHPKTAALLDRGHTFHEEDVTKAFQGRRRLRTELLHLMDEYGLDLWVSPPAPGAAPEGIESTGNPVMNLPWTHAGLPTLTLPAGKNAAGLPLGLQMTGRWQADEALLAWAQPLEMVLSDQP